MNPNTLCSISNMASSCSIVSYWLHSFILKQEVRSMRILVEDAVLVVMMLTDSLKSSGGCQEHSYTGREARRIMPTRGTEIGAGQGRQARCVKRLSPSRCRRTQAFHAASAVPYRLSTARLVIGTRLNDARENVHMTIPGL
jgi:hypothetical protein